MHRAHTSLRQAPPQDLARGLLELVDAVPMAILAIDAKGEVRFANAHAVELFAGVLHRDLGDDGRSPDVSELLAPLDELLFTQEAGAHGAHRPILRVSRDGVERVFRYTITRIPGQDAAPYVVALQDVTQLVQLEDERDRLLKLATVGEVMPMVLHEAKNPLSAAVTTLELLLEEREEPALQADLHGVLVEIRRALLSFEGLGAVGRNLRSARAHAIDHAVREVVTLLEPRARRHGVRLACDVPSLPLLPIDPSSMRGIVLNLVTNAIQACHEADGHVLVRLRLEGASLQLDVIDSGTGMTPEVLARCRELFFTTKRSGSGIGLALCVRLVEEAGGHLDVHSSPDHGTQIAITLPEVGSRRVLPHVDRGPGGTHGSQ